MFKNTKRLLKGIIVLVLVILIIWLYKADFGKDKNIEYGITFSQKYAQEINLNWKEVYLASLNELKVKKIRLVAYWDLIEKVRDEYDFKDLDWAINQASLYDAKIILAIGNRVPRWPECHWPDWSYTLSKTERDGKINQLLTSIVNRYKDSSTIIAWQVENEPFLKVFGECPKPDIDFYKEEIKLVRSLDNRPILVTESGELSTWLKASNLANQVGVSIYRITWNKGIGYFYYPLPPAYYYFKAWLVKFLTPVEDIYVSEMQMEPWLPMKVINTPLDEQYRSMNLSKFRKNLLYSKRTGMSPMYFWGAEWWYWLKEQGNDSIWLEAQKIWED